MTDFRIRNFVCLLVGSLSERFARREENRDATAGELARAGCATIRPIMRPLLVLPLGWLLSSSLAFADFTGKVTKVDDGDTLIVLHDGQEELVRLNGVDAPEKTQAFGRKAKQFTKDTALGKEITVLEHGKDDRGRTIGDVTLPDGTSLNKELVREGLAWWFWKHSQDKSLRDLEDEARAEKRGLWRDRTPIPPWVFRKIQKKQVPEVADFEPPRKASPSTKGVQADGATGPVIGHRKSRIYHRPGCPGYGKVSEQNAVQFANVEEAEEAGYTIARNCPR